MSVIVKDMKMPSKCQYCGLLRYYTENGNVWCNASNKLMMEQAWFEKIDIERPRWCPLIELPEKHGRLIDADVLSYNLDGTMEVSPTGYIHGDTVADMIGDAPTIIEAEGDEG